MNKKITNFIILIVAFILVLSGCTQKNDSTTEDSASTTAATEAVVSTEWKSAYVDYINEHGKVEDTLTGGYMETYKLVDINGDTIPELYINYGTTAGGEVLCTYADGGLIEQAMWDGGFSYIEGQNLFMDFGGHMDSFYNKIYEIADGEFKLLYSGTYGAEDNSDVQMDEEGLPVYQYIWEEQEVETEEEYNELLNAVFDTDQAIKPFDGAEYDSEVSRYVGNGLCDYDEILEEIDAY